MSNSANTNRQISKRDSGLLEVALLVSYSRDWGKQCEEFVNSNRNVSGMTPGGIVRIPRDNFHKGTVAYLKLLFLCRGRGTGENHVKPFFFFFFFKHAPLPM